MSRYPRYSGASYSFGPGPLTPAIKFLIIANVVAFLVSLAVPPIILKLAIVPARVFGELAVWQLVSYMFLHGGIGHLLINMLSLWMFGTELERMWGTRFFTKYYFITGIGAGMTTLLWSLSPLPFANEIYYSPMIGASGAIFGVLLAYALYFPHRPILLMMMFPVPAKYFVMIMGGISLLMAVSAGGGGVAHTTHLGGLAAGYLYLKRPRINIVAEVQYRYVKWRINRMRRKFDVHPGGRADNRRVH